MRRLKTVFLSLSLSLGICLLVSPASVFAVDESITVTTYYPSPYGVYKEMRSQRMAIGDNYISGSAYCWQGSCSTTINSEADLVVEGRVGIGTTAPAYKLSVATATAPAEMEIISSWASGSNLGAIIGFSDTAATTMWLASKYNDNASRFGIRMKGAAAGNEVFSILGSGNVGIGTTNPYSRFSLISDTETEGISLFAGGYEPSRQWGTRIFKKDCYQGIGLPNACSGIPLAIETQFGSTWYTSAIFGHGQNGNHPSLRTYGQTYLATGGGNVGIGTTAPGAKLHVVGSADGQFRLQSTGDNYPYMTFNVNGTNKWELAATPARDSTGAGNFYISNAPETGSAGAKVFIKSDGNVGIGTTTPGYKLQVGNAGDGSEARANAWNTLSDINFKKDIQPINGALSKVLQLNGVNFTWKQSNTRSIGLIAQDVEKVLPEIVSSGSDGYKSISYGGLEAVLVEAVKELRKENDALAVRLQKDKEDIEYLKKELIGATAMQIELNRIIQGQVAQLQAQTQDIRQIRTELVSKLKEMVKEQK